MLKKFMNGKKAKKIRNIALDLLLEGLKNKLPTDSTEINIKNIKSYLPKDRYFINAEGSRCNNFYTPKWAVNQLKKEFKYRPVTTKVVIEII
tara:strand:- start:445 stop:720 length:276 start_codon:yes stop_codon:yes gene_type:complete